MSAIQRAALILGSQAELARRLGVTRARASQIVSGEHPVPLHHAVTIERETAGAVTVEELRPDIDWQVIRGLPATARAAA